MSDGRKKEVYRDVRFFVGSAGLVGGFRSLIVSLYIWPHSVGLTTSLRPTCLVLPPMPMIAFSVRCVYDSFLPLLSNIGRWIGAILQLRSTPQVIKEMLIGGMS